MTLRTPEQSRLLTCPIARVSGLNPTPSKCQAQDCMFWRWEPVPADHPAFLAARAKLMQDGMAHKAAVAQIMADRSAYGVPTSPTHGFCGMAGRPVV